MYSLAITGLRSIPKMDKRTISFKGNRSYSSSTPQIGQATPLTEN
jgi:hypothetical protein